MRKLMLILTAALFGVGVANACDDHHGQCEVEDWRWYSVSGGMVMLEGVTTCNAGQVILRLYQGEGGAFLGVADGFIEGHAFQAMATNLDTPSTVAIKYSIKPE